MLDSIEVEELKAVLVLLSIVLTVCYQSYVIFKISRSRDISGSNKLLWIAIVFVAPVLGASVYLISKNKKRNFKIRRFKSPFDNAQMRS